jgi:hypothetical protein
MNASNILYLIPTHISVMSQLKGGSAFGQQLLRILEPRQLTVDRAGSVILLFPPVATLADGHQLFGT